MGAAPPERRIYDARTARAYTDRSPVRHARECALLRRALLGLPRGLSVLDLPCGTGRLAPLLTELGFKHTGCDLSREMLLLAGGGLEADAFHLPFRDRAFDLVVSFRFLHHIPPPSQPALLRELARVTRRVLVVSFFHPWSTHGMLRRLRCLLCRRQSGRFSTPPARLRELAREAGLGPGKLLAQTPLLRELWIGVFSRPCNG